MVAFSICRDCNESPPRHCKGKNDRKSEPGKTGGFRCACTCRPKSEQK